MITKTDSVDEFIDTIDRGWYGGVYVKEDVYHILALSQYYDALAEKAEQEYDGQEETALVVDNPGEAVIYSLDQLEAARTVLNQLGEKMGIVGLSNWIDLESSPITNGLGVDINETVELTDQLKEEILSQVEVKNLRFSSGSESNPNTTATSAPAFYGETVTDIYALETNTYTTVQYQGDASAAEELLLLLEGMPEDTVKTSSTERAYIVFTETGRHYIYLDKESTSKVLWDLWEEITSFEENGRHIHWFTHMTPEKITEIRSGLGPLLTERADIEAAAEFLKKQVRIDPTKGISISEGADNPNMSAALYHIVITFDTGVEYSIIGYGDYAGMIDEGGSGISIWTSDLDRTVYYTLTEGCAAEIRQFFAQQ